MKINDKNIGEQYPAYFIADIAANYDCELSRAKELIYKAAEAGADAAKFQHYNAKTIVSDYGFKKLNALKSHQSSWSKTVFEVYKDSALNLDWTPELKETCEDAGIAFFTSPYSIEIVDHIDPFVPAYKIGSGDITWIEMVNYIASKNKPYILATGASTFDDVYRAVSTALKINPQLCLMQCNTNYTASLENFKYINLNVLKTYRQMYPNLILGLSDHTPGHATVLGAIALGAKMIEKHFTDDVKRVGPDHKFSMDPLSWKEMVDRSRELENALGVGVKKVEDNEAETVILQRRAIRSCRDLKKGEILDYASLEVLRPCPLDALEPHYIGSIVDKKLVNDIKMGDIIRWKDLE